MNRYVARIWRRPMQTGFIWKSGGNRLFRLYGRIILKLILNIYGGSALTKFICLRIGTRCGPF